MVKKYIEKEPTPMEAIQWTGKNLSEVEDFIGNYGKVSPDNKSIILYGQDKNQKVQEGDWILKDPETGDLYKMADFYFKMYYIEEPKKYDDISFNEHIILNKMLANEI